MINSSGLKHLRLTAAFPYLSLLVWLGFLLLINPGQASLMAHDEGYYAQQARWIWETGDWITLRWWDQLVYDRTIGIHWLITASYSLFGIHEASARLPSLLACVCSVLLTYRIGSVLLNARVAWLGAAVLSVTPLWVQYGRLATQDLVLVCLELVAIWGLLQAEQDKRYRVAWGVVAGSMLGFGFLVKGFMILLPPIALAPYLIWQHRQHRHLSNPGLYIGLLLGAILPGIWLWASWVRYGALPFQQLVGKLIQLGEKGWYDAGPLYYVWNIAINAFPWPLFTLIGVVLVLRQASLKRQLLLLGYPILLFLELSTFKTRTPYYPLQLMPFMALLAGFSLDWLQNSFTWQVTGSTRLIRFAQRRFRERLSAILSYAFGGLAVILIVAAMAVLLGIIQLGPTVEAKKYSAIALALGVGWLTLPVLWHNRRYDKLSANYWVASWLLGPWLALAAVGGTGVFGDYSPQVKTLLQQPAIAAVVQTHPVNFVIQSSLGPEGHKNWVLLSFYTPKLGRSLSKVADLSPNTYAWVSPPSESMPALPYQPLATFQGWQLIQVPASASQS